MKQNYLYLLIGLLLGCFSFAIVNQYLVNFRYLTFPNLQQELKTKDFTCTYKAGASIDEYNIRSHKNNPIAVEIEKPFKESQLQIKIDTENNSLTSVNDSLPWSAEILYTQDNIIFATRKVEYDWSIVERSYALNTQTGTLIVTNSGFSQAGDKYVIGSTAAYTCEDEK